MVISAQEHKSLLNRLERLEDVIQNQFSVGNADDLIAPVPGRIIAARYSSAETSELPIYTIMKLNLSGDATGTAEKRTLRIPDLDFPEVDEDDQLIVATQQVAQPGDIIPIMIDGITLIRVNSRSSLSDIGEDPNQVIKIGEQLFIYNDETNPQSGIVSFRKGIAINKTEDDADKDLQRFISNSPFAVTLETQKPDALRVRSLLRPRTINLPINFEDGVTVDEAQASTKLYSLVTWDVEAEHAESFSGGGPLVTTRKRAVLRLEKPFRVNTTTPKFKLKLGVDIVGTFSYDIGTTHTNPTFATILSVNLVLVDLFEDTFKLEDLTWDKVVTLLGTASNFEPLQQIIQRTATFGDADISANDLFSVLYSFNLFDLDQDDIVGIFNLSGFVNTNPLVTGIIVEMDITGPAPATNGESTFSRGIIANTRDDQPDIVRSFIEERVFFPVT